MHTLGCIQQSAMPVSSERVHPADVWLQASRRRGTSASRAFVFYLESEWIVFYRSKIKPHLARKLLQAEKPQLPILDVPQGDNLHLGVRADPGLDIQSTQQSFQFPSESQGLGFRVRGSGIRVGV